MTTPSTPELIRLAQAADPQALTTIYEHYSPAIYRYIYYRVGDVELARDLHADVFLRMIEGISRYEDRGWSISSWLYRIAHDRTIDTLRRRDRFAQLPLEAWSEYYDGPDGDLESSSRRTAVRRAMARLNDCQRRVLLLRFVYDLSIQETARQMGRSEGSIKALQHRAQQNLTQLLQEELREEE